MIDGQLKIISNGSPDNTRMYCNESELTGVTGINFDNITSESGALKLSLNIDMPILDIWAEVKDVELTQIESPFILNSAVVKIGSLLHITSDGTSSGTTIKLDSIRLNCIKRVEFDKFTFGGNLKARLYIVSNKVA